MQSVFWQVLRSSSAANGLRSKEGVIVSVCLSAHVYTRVCVRESL